MSAVLAVTGTTTDVGKTIVTAALAAAVRAAGRTVAVAKPAQTGVGPDDPGDLAVITRLAGPMTTAECVRYPDPLAPDTAARRAGLPPLTAAAVTDAVAGLSAGHDLTVVEGAGGILVRLADDYTLLDVASDIGADVLVVVPAGLGALNHAELTVDAVRRADLHPAGLVIGAWPADPDLAMRCNRTDLPRLTGVPIVGAIPAGAGEDDPTAFRAAATGWFDADWLAALASSGTCPADTRVSASSSIH
ncbi:dethiobiotin synthase [Gordonia sinesedis]